MQTGHSGGRGVNREMKLREWMFVAEERGGKERREERLGRGREGGLQEEREEFVF